MSELMRAPKELPVHPWLHSNEQLPEGKGNYYYYGPNYTVDPIVIAGGDTPSILLVKRHDTGDWALPGGFVDPGEDVVTAALRELKEETDIIPVDQVPSLVYSGPVGDPRSTKNAWPETTALLWRIDAPVPVQTSDETDKVEWFPIIELPTKLYGSHADLIAQAIISYGSDEEKIAYLGEIQETTSSDGGHMGYRHFIASSEQQSVFLKRHDAARFTDPARAEHSLAYLRKEHSVYRQLAPQSQHVSRYSECIDDQTLAIEAFGKADGWMWQAPSEPLARENYIRDVLGALKSLRSMHYIDESTITPTHISMHDEGWGSYGESKRAIVDTLTQSGVEGSSNLLLELDDLYELYAHTQPAGMTEFAHGDIRQSNLTWHPELGVKIVDWSWAGPAAPGLDTTSFLIDVAKFGVDVSEYSVDFNTGSALLLIGFWLHHATWPTNVGNEDVRAHQIASAICALGLLKYLTK